jgi:hypothetical protein
MEDRYHHRKCFIMGGTGRCTRLTSTRAGDGLSVLVELSEFVRLYEEIQNSARGFWAHNLGARQRLQTCNFVVHESLQDEMAQRSAFPRSHILIFGPSSVQSLLPVTPISQAEALLESHRIEDVIELADKQRKKVQGKFVVDPDEVRRVLWLFNDFGLAKLPQADELAYIYQRIGFQCLLETRFEDAGFCLFQGELDPRILISYFPDLRGTLLDANPTLDIFSGIAECMPPYDSIDDISTSPPFTPLPPFPLPLNHNDARPSPLCWRLTC